MIRKCLVILVICVVISAVTAQKPCEQDVDCQPCNAFDGVIYTCVDEECEDTLPQCEDGETCANPDFVCNRHTGKCQPFREQHRCETNDDCECAPLSAQGFTRSCIDNTCRVDCNADGVCPRNRGSCNTHNHCVKGPRGRGGGGARGQGGRGQGWGGGVRGQGGRGQGWGGGVRGQGGARGQRGGGGAKEQGGREYGWGGTARGRGGRGQGGGRGARKQGGRGQGGGARGQGGRGQGGHEEPVDMGGRGGARGIGGGRGYTGRGSSF